MTRWCSSDNSRLLRLSCCTAFLQNMFLHTAEWIMCEWDCIGFVLSPLWILSLAFSPQLSETTCNPLRASLLLHGLKKDLNWRNEVLRHWMKSLTNTKTSLRHMWLNMHYVTGVSCITTACKTITGQSTTKSTAKSTKMWLKMWQKKSHKHGVLKKKGEKNHISLKNQIPDPLLCTSAVL